MPSVWAPFAKQLELDAAGRRVAMSRDADGWWTCDDELPAGTDYWFVVDGDRLPDPRSPWQPSGVHGPSRTFDHREFPWTDAAFQARPLASAVIYELHIGTFTPAGTFDSAIEKLDHLVDLGVTHVELMPVAEFLGDHGWGYDGVNPFAPHHAYGGPTGLKRLVDACHARGLGVLLDVVYNHLGPVGNYLPRFGPYFQSKWKTPWGDALNFDGPDSDEVRRYFCDNALMWLRDYHFDGLRLDAVHAIVDRAATPFLEQLATEVDALKAHLGRHLVLTAESDANDPRVVRPWELGGFGLDAQWSDDVHHAIHGYLAREQIGYYSDFGSLADLAAAMTRPYVYDGRRSQHRRRMHGRPPVNLGGGRFVVFSQNHDHVGNRADGERLAHLAGLRRAKIAAGLVLLSPYVPLLFQGEEWGALAPFRFFVDFDTEPELKQAVIQGRRREFAGFGRTPEEIPDPTSREAFQVSKLDWRELDAAPHREMLAWYRTLTSLRRTYSDLTDGRLDRVAVAYDDKSHWLRIERGALVIVCNFGDADANIPLSADGAAYRLAASSNPIVAPHGTEAKLSAETLAVFVHSTTPTDRN